MCVVSSQVKNEAKVNTENKDVISLELNKLQTTTTLLSYDCKIQTKNKLEDENKTNTFFHVCLTSLFDGK